MPRFFLIVIIMNFSSLFKIILNIHNSLVTLFRGYEEIFGGARLYKLEIIIITFFYIWEGDSKGFKTDEY